MSDAYSVLRRYNEKAYGFECDISSVVVGIILLKPNVFSGILQPAGCTL